MTAILGISAYYHDSAAALVVDGKIVAAAQEERFTRRKHDYSFPKHAIDYCLREAGLSPEDLDYVGFYKPFLRHAPCVRQDANESHPILFFLSPVRHNLRYNFIKVVTYPSVT